MKRFFMVLLTIVVAITCVSCSAKENAQMSPTSENENREGSRSEQSVAENDNLSFDQIDYAANLKMKKVEGYYSYQTGNATIFSDQTTLLYCAHSLLPIDKTETGQWTLSDFVSYIPLTFGREVSCSKDDIILQDKGVTKVNGIEMQSISGTISDYSDEEHAIKGYMFDSNGYKCIVLAAEYEASSTLSAKTISDLDTFMQNMVIDSAN